MSNLIEEFYNTLDKLKYLVNQVKTKPNLKIVDIQQELDLILSKRK